MRPREREAGGCKENNKQVENVNAGVHDGRVEKVALQFTNCLLSTREKEY